MTTRGLIIILVVIVLVLGCACIGAALALARKLDALHTRIGKTRTFLNRTLIARARQSLQVAQSGVLDVASSMVLIDAAQECLLAADDPLVDDSLDSIVIYGTPMRQQVELPSRRRLQAESSLSRALRATVDELQDSDLTADDRSRITELNNTRLSLRLARTFHNADVGRVRQLRRHVLARIFPLAGHVAAPTTIDMDDE
ncbi:MAG: hypothetical protein SPI12_05350 [Actinomycetaceae bacterium]|nr:hypothetical protein [Actinomycetaceae bacterium]